ncbi:hypothetical protein OG311_37070 [Streptomyces sp. NBC_01343]|uniref:hypothetical protein n=1 Tax=Streptomyces sp. NBC_01343 TaxID=2903832 RepID=UPI002E165011|nr:hypothetical protein OG311_37070 [Streptomyces sp. NBC_01343]
MPVAAEHREGQKRDLYKHWNKGLNAGDGCGTRTEVILSKAAPAPLVAAGCKLTGGSWRSAHDDVVVTDAARLDVDHFVPLVEVYGFEQVAWSAARREAYTNDQASPDTLCTYAAAWIGAKVRWGLAVAKKRPEQPSELLKPQPRAISTPLMEGFSVPQP